MVSRSVFERSRLVNFVATSYLGLGHEGLVYSELYATFNDICKFRTTRLVAYIHSRYLSISQWLFNSDVTIHFIQLTNSVSAVTPSSSDADWLMVSVVISDHWISSMNVTANGYFLSFSYPWAEIKPAGVHCTCHHICPCSSVLGDLCCTVYIGLAAHPSSISSFHSVHGLPFLSVPSFIPVMTLFIFLLVHSTNVSEQSQFPPHDWLHDVVRNIQSSSHSHILLFSSSNSRSV